MKDFPDIYLERYLAQELSPSAARELELAAKSNVELANRLALLRRSSSEFLDHVDPALFARRLEGRLEQAQVGRRTILGDWFTRWSPGIAMACVVGVTSWALYQNETLSPGSKSDQDLLIKATPPALFANVPEEELAQLGASPKAGPKVGSVDPLPVEPSTEPLAVKKRERPATASPRLKARRELSSGVETHPVPVTSSPPSVNTLDASAPHGGASRMLRRAPALAPASKRAAAPRQAAPAPTPQFLDAAQGELAAESVTTRRKSSKRKSTHVGRAYALGSTAGVSLTLLGGGKAQSKVAPGQSISGGGPIQVHVHGRGVFYWTHWVIHSKDGSLLRAPALVSLWQPGVSISQWDTLEKSSRLWIALSNLPFSIEDVVVEGKKIRSQNDNVQLMEFFVIF